MDEEDLADAAEAQRVQTSDAFSGLGDSAQREMQAGGLAGLFRPQGDTMGLRLLRKMGWKDGQGIGPRIKRAARLDDGNGALQANAAVHSFAPKNVPVVKLVEKTDKKGLGFQGQSKLASLSKTDNAPHDDDDDEQPGFSKPKPIPRGGIGMGILNDTGSDEEDPYEIGPAIKYNRVMGGEKKKKKKAAAAANPSLKNAPVFVPKNSRSGNRLQRCQDGKLPLDGFVLTRAVEDVTAMLAKLAAFAPPTIPQGWKSSLSPQAADNTEYKSTADAAKESTMDPKARAVILGEKTLPGKSVFDFLSPAAREQMVSASGNTNLPPARGEIPAGFEPSAEEQKVALLSRIQLVDRDTAIAAIARGSRGPYADNDAKRARYKAYLDHVINSEVALPEQLPRTTDDDYVKEMNEYYNCARIFKPMTGFMASRFTTAKSSSTLASSGTPESQELLSQPAAAPKDPAEEAAKVGMYGTMTRTVVDFYPTRLLCKRFNVRPPEHVSKEAEGPPSSEAAATQGPVALPFSETKEAQLLTIQSKEDLQVATPSVIDPTQNAAVEGKTANADVLHAIFGDSDDDDE